MAAALPIIASAVGQIPSILERRADRDPGAAGEPAAVAEALIRLAEDPALRERARHLRPADAVQRFSWDGVLTRITHCLPPIRRVAAQ